MIKTVFSSASLLMQNKSKSNQGVSRWILSRWQCVASDWKYVALKKKILRNKSGFYNQYEPLIFTLYSNANSQ